MLAILTIACFQVKKKTWCRRNKLEADQIEKTANRWRRGSIKTTSKMISLITISSLLEVYSHLEWNLEEYWKKKRENIKHWKNRTTNKIKILDEKRISSKLLFYWKMESKYLRGSILLIILSFECLYVSQGMMARPGKRSVSVNKDLCAEIVKVFLKSYPIFFRRKVKRNYHNNRINRLHHQLLKKKKKIAKTKSRYRKK